MFTCSLYMRKIRKQQYLAQSKESVDMDFSRLIGTLTVAAIIGCGSSVHAAGSVMEVAPAAPLPKASLASEVDRSPTAASDTKSEDDDCD